MLRHSEANTPRRTRPKRRIAVAFAAVFAISVAAVSVAVGAGTSSSPAPSPGMDVAQQTPMATSISTQQRAAFAVLRRDSVGTDALPASTAEQVSNSLSVKRGGMNTGLARRAAADAGTVWVVPGQGYTCLLIADVTAQPGATDVPAGSTGCMKDDDATAGKMVMSEQYNATHPRHEFVVGLVPDGVEQATAQLSDGSAQTLAVHDNVYTADFIGVTADTVSFTAPNGDAVVVHP